MSGSQPQPGTHCTTQILSLVTSSLGGRGTTGTLRLCWIGTMRSPYPLYCVDNHSAGCGASQSISCRGLRSVTQPPTFHWRRRYQSPAISTKMLDKSENTSNRPTWRKYCPMGVLGRIPGCEANIMRKPTPRGTGFDAFGKLLRKGSMAIQISPDSSA